MEQEQRRRLVTRIAGLRGIKLEVVIRVGGSRCRLERLASLEPGDVIHLDRRIGEPFDLTAGEILLARVEPVAHPDGIAMKVVEVPEADSDADR